MTRGPQTAGSGRPRFLHLPAKEKALLIKRLAVLLRAGVPLLQGVRLLEGQATSRTARAVLAALVADIENGQYLHVSLGRFRGLFGDFVLNLVRIGEVTGTLSENLEYLSEELKKKQRLRSTVVGALVYPACIVLATLGITVLLVTYVFPKIIPIVASLHADLPWSTRALMAASRFAGHDWYWVLLASAAALATSVLAYRRSTAVRLRFDRVLIRVPLVGRVLQSYHVANTCRTLGMLLRSDVRIVEAATIVGETSTNAGYRRTLVRLAETLRRGGKISDVLAAERSLFPVAVSQLVSVGERTGNLSASLLYLSAMFEDEVDDLTKSLSTVLEPFLMVFMGLLVGFVAISIITPIYGITQNLRA